MHAQESRRIFNERIKGGHKLTYEELRALKNEEWKFDYIRQQLLEDDIIRELLYEQQQVIDGEYDNLADAREQTEEISYTFVQAKKNMAKRLQKRMMELGITKKVVDMTLFNEFNIRDMIQQDQKKWCKTCLKGR